MRAWRVHRRQQVATRGEWKTRWPGRPATFWVMVGQRCKAEGVRLLDWDKVEAIMQELEYEQGRRDRSGHGANG